MKGHTHAPVILHRTGGIPASLLNVCGGCGSYIVPSETEPDTWVEITEDQEAALRKEWAAMQDEWARKIGVRQ